MVLSLRTLPLTRRNKKKMNPSALEKFLKKIYYDVRHPAGYSSIANLRKAALAAGFADASWGKIKKWLSRQETYTLFKQARKKFKRNSVPAVGLHYQYEADLADMTKYASDNDGYKFILTVLDTFSRYGWSEPVKSKSARDVGEALSRILAKAPHPEIFRSDKGGEFVNRKVKKMLEDADVKQIVSNNEQKASTIERWIQTLKKVLTKDMYQRQNNRWVSRLADATKGYNSKIHSATGKAPKDVDKNNEDRIRFVQYLKKRRREEPPKPKAVVLKAEDSTVAAKTDPDNQQPREEDDETASKKKKKKRKRKKRLRFKKDDIVRISYLKDKFTRAYNENFSHELFRVVKGFFRDDIPQYKIKDWSGENIVGSFYQPELTLAAEPEGGLYKIDQIIRSKKVGKKKQYLVSYVGWPSKYNSWVAESAVKDIKKT